MSSDEAMLVSRSGARKCSGYGQMDTRAEANSGGRDTPSVGRPELLKGVGLSAAVGCCCVDTHPQNSSARTTIARRTDRCWSSGHEHIHKALVSMGVRARVA